MRHLPLFTVLNGLAILFAGSAFANPDPSFPKVSRAIAEQQICYMHSAKGFSLDLSSLCGTPTVASGFNTISSRSANTSSSLKTYPSFSGLSGSPSSKSGKCDFSWQTDSLGRKCGGRAASRRPGGRNPIESYGYTPSFTPSYTSGSTYVNGYTRKDGTYVRGYTRRK